MHFIFQSLADLKRRLLSTVCSSVREGLAAVRIAEFLNKELQDLGEEIGLRGLVLVLDTGQQCTIAGAGTIFDNFRHTGQVNNYTGYGEEPTKFYDRKNYHTAPCRLMNFDETYYKMPYDCRSCKLISKLLFMFVNNSQYLFS